MKTKINAESVDKIRMVAIILLSLFVIATGTLWSLNTFAKGDIAGAVTGGLIAITILVFAIFVYIRGNKDMREGYPLKDERSERVMEKASSRAFYVSLYLLLAVGFLSSEGMIKFRDVSQAIGLSMGGMALLFAVFWVYYNRKEI
jgi:uncharacterized membrane protein